MIAALVWKEYREQRIAWAALAVVGAATVFGLPLLLDADNRMHTGDLIAAAVVFVAWGHGLICGAMLLAGERENGTLPFLDALPGLRGQLWRVKCLAGVLLVIVQVAALMSLCMAAHLFETWAAASATIIGMAGAGMFGLAWGMLFSALGRSVLNMILLSLAGQLAAVILLLVPAGFLSLATAAVLGLPEPADGPLCWAAVAAVSIPVALGGSALIFTRLDRGRLRPSRPLAPVRTGRAPSAWGRLFWLTGRQSRGFAAGMGVFALLLGFLTLIDGLIVWPAATLLVGVLCGATAFADEQQGPVRFLGDQRLPLMRFWIVKVGFRFLLAVAAAFVVLLPSLIRGLAAPDRGLPGAMYFDYAWCSQVFHSGVLARFGPPELFVTLWLVCGFCAGCLFGLLIRNGLASGVFALGAAFLLAGVWIPSILGNGLNFWQAFGPPLVLLASTPLLLRPWAAGRIASWSTAYRLAPFVLVAAAWTAFGLWYRIREIPDVAPKYDLVAFRARLPTADDNPAGDRVRAACYDFAQLQERLDANVPAPRRLPDGQEAPSPGLQRLFQVLNDGWPIGDADLDALLAKMCGGKWRSQLAEAADLPTGMVEDPRLLTLDDLNRPSAMQHARWMALVLAAHGLQRQARGDPQAFLEDFRVGLSLSRNLRHFASRRDATRARDVDDVLLIGLDRWLADLNSRPDLPKQALDILSKHLEEAAVEDGDRVLVDYLIARNTLDSPVGWLTADLSGDRAGPGSDERARAEAMLVVQARLVPWEHARQERMLRVLFEGDRAQRQWLRNLWRTGEMLGSLRRLDPSTLYPEPNGFVRCQPTVMLLKLALLSFQGDRGRAAENLDKLVPNYLPKLPDDPYTLVPNYLVMLPDDPYTKGQPFHYRVSKGETIGLPPDVPGQAPLPPGAPARSVYVPPGVGVLWSVGSDGIDDHGVKQAGPEGHSGSGEDLIFLVPLRAKGK